MPYVKSICIHSTPNRSLAYIANKSKTDSLLYVTGFNCSSIPSIAYNEMKVVFEEYSKHKFNEATSLNRKSVVKAIHYIQSFKPTDKITPEQAHAIANEWAEAAFGSERQMLISTHIDKNHIHSHIIINVYDFNGVKFNDNLSTLSAVRSLSDTLCVNYGIQPIRTGIKTHSVKYNEWENNKKGTSWKQQIRSTIDTLIMRVNSIDELLAEMEHIGYTIKRGKYISIKAFGQKRFVRTTTLGEEYEEESLKERIRISVSESGFANKPKRNINELNGIYFKRIREVSELILEKRITPKKYNSKNPYSLHNDLTVYTIAKQLALINREKITSIGELEGKLAKTKIEHESVKNELNKLILNIEQLKTVIEHCDMYFYLKSKPVLTAAETVKLKICTQTKERVGIFDNKKLENVRKLKLSYEKKAADLDTRFHLLDKQLSDYTEIVDTYRKISSEDYISSLMEERKNKRNRNI